MLVSLADRRPAMDTSPRFGLPLIMAAQAQKHLTHNEALALLEVLVQPVVQDMAALEPPAQPVESSCVVVGPDATGTFGGHDGALAVRLTDAWHFFMPEAGWMVIHAADRQAHVYDGNGWVPMPAPAVQNNLEQVGINAAASPANRLTVAGDASLFTAETADHRVTVNKAGAGDTASLLFQSGWSGRAEMGLAGSDEFSVKVSADGTAWQDALRVDPATGVVDLPQKALARASLEGGSASLAAGQAQGFQALSMSQGGVSLGAPLGTPAAGAPLLVAHAGIYSLQVTFPATLAAGFSLVRNGNDVIARFEAGLSGGALRSVGGEALAMLQPGDAISLRFEDAASCVFSAQTSFLSLVRL
jgi:hypothetical protein